MHGAGVVEWNHTGLITPRGRSSRTPATIDLVRLLYCSLEMYVAPMIDASTSDVLTTRPEYVGEQHSLPLGDGLVQVEERSTRTA